MGYMEHFDDVDPRRPEWTLLINNSGPSNIKWLSNALHVDVKFAAILALEKFPSVALSDDTTALPNLLAHGSHSLLSQHVTAQCHSLSQLISGGEIPQARSFLLDLLDLWLFLQKSSFRSVCLSPVAGTFY
jgi:hypothetical protein